MSLNMYHISVHALLILFQYQYMIFNQNLQLNSYRSQKIIVTCNEMVIL